jgi:hypothetical protein
MSDAGMDLLRTILADGGTADAVGKRLGPGCSLEQKTESREVFNAGQPIKIEHRTGHRIAGCTNPNQDTDWLWGDWS